MSWDSRQDEVRDWLAFGILLVVVVVVVVRGFSNLFLTMIYYLDGVLTSIWKDTYRVGSSSFIVKVTFWFNKSKNYMEHFRRCVSNVGNRQHSHFLVVGNGVVEGLEAGRS